MGPSKFELDQQPVLECPACATLSDNLEWVRTALAARGRVLVKVQVDGAWLSGPALVERSREPMGDATVRCESEDRGELARRTLAKLWAVVTSLREQHASVANEFQSGRTVPANAQFIGIIQGWQQVYEAFGSLVKMLNLDLSTLSAGEIPALRLVASFQHQLQELAAAVRTQDTVLLADMLQYEMEATVSDFQKLLAATLGWVDAQCTQVPAPAASNGRHVQIPAA